MFQLSREVLLLFLFLQAGKGSGERCNSPEVPNDSRCTGCPPMYNGKLCASTTRYNDLTKASCGCGNSDPVPTDWWTITQFTAALNCKNLDPSNPLLSWCPERCGACYQLCTTGGTTQGVSTESGVCRTFKVTNRCGDGFGQYAEWCSNELSWQECQSDPDLCRQEGSTNKFGYPAHFDLQDYHLQISNLAWDNVEVTFEPVPCDGWDGPSWDCFCPSIETNVTATRPPTPQPSLCASWCESNSNPWSSKCSWRQCSECAACTDASSTEPPSAVTTAPSVCSAAGDDCRSTKCCSDAAFTCFEKNEWWASCKATCSPGIDSSDPPQFRSPWSCVALRSTTSSTSNLAAATSTTPPTSSTSPRVSTTTTTTVAASTTVTTLFDSTTRTTTPDTNTITPAVCSDAGQDCGTTKCCNDSGLTCYKKDAWWAECKETCTPGINLDDAPEFRTPWECQSLPAKSASCTSGTQVDCRATGCCSDPSLTCYEKNQWWAECRAMCTPGIDMADAPEYRTPWSCRKLEDTSSVEPSPACSLPGHDCRDSRCCSDDSLTCYEKDAWWAECKDSCAAGIDPNDAPQFRTPWTCKALTFGGRLLQQQDKLALLV